MASIIKRDDNMKKFGFGCMRLPCNSDNPEDIDMPQVFEMVDKYIESGFNYFDTAYGYHEGLSEVAIRKAVIERYPREDVIIADKLPVYSLNLHITLKKYSMSKKKDVVLSILIITCCTILQTISTMELFLS